MLAALLSSQTIAGTPATVGAAPGIGSVSSAPGKATGQVASLGGGVFGPGMVGVYAPRRPPPAAKLVSIPAVARALPGQGYTHSAPGRAIGKEPPQFATARARAAPGECFSQVAPGRAVGAVRALAPAGTGTSSSAQGRAAGAAAVTAHAPQGRADLARGCAIGLHNPTDEELAAAFLFLLDDRLSLEA